ncbi:MAG: hypothetical protein HYU29_08760 [Chloroflexi bacterium]|nr:hypothetical protein [Chloroflexota bacterium]
MAEGFILISGVELGQPSGDQTRRLQAWIHQSSGKARVSGIYTVSGPSDGCALACEAADSADIQDLAEELRSSGFPQAQVVTLWPTPIGLVHSHSSTLDPASFISEAPFPGAFIG